MLQGLAVCRPMRTADDRALQRPRQCMPFYCYMADRNQTGSSLYQEVRAPAVDELVAQTIDLIGKACENSARQSHPKAPKLDLKQNPAQTSTRPRIRPKSGRSEIGMTGRLQIGIGGRLHGTRIGPRFADPQDWMCQLMGCRATSWPKALQPIKPCLPASPGSTTRSTRRCSTDRRIMRPASHRPIALASNVRGTAFPAHR